jgi:quercetin dioxygenase-like cupin family protein
MKVKQVREVAAQAVTAEGADGVAIRWLLGADDAPENFYMRLFELAPGGHTPRHGHPWEHEVYVLEGEGAVSSPAGEVPLAPQSVVHVPAGEEHQFRNTGRAPLRFLCLVPKTAAY